MDFKKFQKMKSEGAIFEGMLPKLDNSFNALRSGVARVIIGKPELLRDMDRKHTVLTL
jgi:acetylglutamate kinase